MAERARPIHDRIIIRAEETTNVSKGGIHVVEFREKPQRCGEVVAVGPGVHDQRGRFIPTSLKPGERVAFGTYAGTEIVVEGEKFRVMRESDVACVVDHDAEVETDGFTTRRTGAAAHYQ